MISRRQIQEALLESPPPGDRQRIHYIGSKCGQLFGWVTQPDTYFLVDWLPGVSAAYPHQPMRIVEIGTFAGSTARGLVVLSGGGQITCVDNFSDMNPGTLNGHPSGRAYWEWTLKERVDLSPFATLIEGDAGEVGRLWTSAIDLLFVDGDHAYESALRDLERFAPFVVQGGYCLVDDYHMPSVKRACDEFFFRECNWLSVRVPEWSEASPASILCMKRI